MMKGRRTKLCQTSLCQGKMGSFVQERERAKKKESFGMGEEAWLLRRSEKVL